MITNKDIRVENGNIVINGDKNPLASQAEIDVLKDDIDDLDNKIGDITQTGVTGDTVAEQIGELNKALTSHDNATVQQLNVFKSNKTISIYGLLQNLSSTDTLVEYTTLEEKYRPAAGYVIAPLISTTAPYLPVGSVWIHGSTGKVSIYKEAARTDGYVSLTYLV